VAAVVAVVAVAAVAAVAAVVAAPFEKVTHCPTPNCPDHN